MGDISGRPKTPAPQVVFVPQPTTQATTAQPQSTTSNAPPTTTETTPEKQREQNLLSRPRSRFGTILTGFRGILSESDQAQSAQRKTLLGE